MTDAVNRVTEVITGGDSAPQSLLDRIGAATSALEQATETYKTDHSEIAAEARAKAAGDLSALKQEADAERAKADDARNAEIDATLAWAKGYREPSKAHLFGNGLPDQPAGYKAGDFAYNLWARKSREHSIRGQMAAEDRLTEMGIRFMDAPEKAIQKADQVDPLTGAPTELSVGRGGFEIPRLAIETAAAGVYQKYAGVADEGGLNPNLARLKAKATLGLTAATGGVLIPGAEVADLVKPGRYRSAVPRLVDGMNVDSYQTTIPVRVSAPTRAAVVAWGDTKTNTNLAYGSYTATMYTLAIIYDIAKQLLRFSRGAVERDVLQELAHAFELGQAYYILQGSGTNEPYGIQTAIATAFSAYTTAFTASATTLAGSVAKALASAAGDLAVRNRAPEAAIVGAAAYWNMLSQGTDTAGFFFAPAGGPLTVRVDSVNGGAAPWGIPVFPETQLAGTDDLLVGEWSALDVFYGESYRVDTSDEAGDRWDKNLVGFRGEQEMGLDARAAVFAGAFQFVADIAP